MSANGFDGGGGAPTARRSFIAMGCSETATGAAAGRQEIESKKGKVKMQNKNRRISS
jgi:hypothetical protein